MPREHLDHVRIYSEISDALDARCKEIIPGRAPWATRTEARRWLSGEYAYLLQWQADACAVSVSCIRRDHSPGVAPFFPSITSLFGSSSWERARDRDARAARRQEREGQKMAARYDADARKLPRFGGAA